MQQSPNQLTALHHNLRAGYRLATGRPSSSGDFIYSLDQVLWLGLVILLLHLFADYLSADAPVAFNLYGTNYLGASYLLLLVVLMLGASIAGAGMAATGRLLLAYLAAKPTLFVVTEIAWVLKDKLSDSRDASWLLYMVLMTWGSYVVVRLLRRYSDADSPRLLGIVIVYVLILYGSLWVLPHSNLWYTAKKPGQDNRYAELNKLNVEDIFYAQPAMVEGSLARLEAQRPRVTDLYFLGVGGYGLENVFLHEVEYVRNEFDQLYGTTGRSLILANNASSVGLYPLANAHNLEAILNGIAARMDVDEDVLFLFMTSHGSDKPSFSLAFGPIKLNDLGPQQLRDALDRAGIRWRVIVVSSCYSGGFVEALREPNTLIITAAAKDKQSFGCGAGSDFTDFGNAYFKIALQQQPDFAQAFDIAANWVAEKEQREKREASHPQRFIGEAIQAKLTSMFAQPVTALMQEQQEPCDSEHEQGTCNK